MTLNRLRELKRKEGAMKTKTSVKAGYVIHTGSR
jgi:hypothetical protein